jgi:hypothetical protein
MKMQFRPLSLLVLILLSGLHVCAQLFPQVQPYMYDRGYEAFSPAPGVKRIVFSRYIAGSRFPQGWDVVVESYSYDPQGHITKWNRYQNITGEANIQTSYAWTPEGLLLGETILLASDHSEIMRNYAWEKDANGKFTKATITDKAQKPIATLEILPDGRYVQTELTLGSGKVLRSTYNAQRQLLLSENTASGLIEEYAYDAKGVLASVNIKNTNGTTTKIQYETKRDDKGNVVAQTESGRGNPKTFYFKYDAAGHMLEKGIIANQPNELRGYDAMGKLTDILFFDPQGYQKEMLNISYEMYFK